MDVLAMGAPVLVPRLAFNLMSENMLFVSLRAMMRDFTVLTGLACVSLSFCIDTIKVLTQTLVVFCRLFAFYDMVEQRWPRTHHNIEMDALGLVRTRWNWHSKIRRLPLAFGTRPHGCIRLPRQHTLPHDPRFHA